MRSTADARGAGTAAAIALLLIGLVAVFVERTAAELQDAMANVQHTHEVIARLQRLDASLGDSENARRGYALTSDATFVEEYESARARVRVLRNELRELIRDNPDQQRRMDELDGAFDARLAALERAISASRAGADDERDAQATREGRALGARTRGVLSAMSAEEERLLKERRIRTEDAVRWQRRAQIVGIAMALGLLAWAVARLRRETMTRARSEAAQATILHSIAEAVIATDTDGRVTRMNAVAEKLTGWSRDEAFGRPASEVFRLEREEREGDSDEDGGKVLVAKNGTELPVAHYEAPIEDPDGTGSGSGSVVVFRDVTAERAVEAERRRLTAFFDSIIENIPNMVFVKDATNLRFELLNRAGEELLGMSRGDLIGKSDADFFPKEQARAFVDADRDVLANGVVKDIPEEPIDTKRGRVWLHTKKVPVFDAAGRPRYLLGISEDITERRRAHEELAAARDALAASNDELESFSYSVAHDLRAPLRAIDGFSQALLEDYTHALDANGQDFLRRISTAARRMGDLIDALLQLARLSRAEAAVQPIDLSALARGIAAELSTQYPRTHVDIAPKLVARGDIGLVRVAVQNLLDNAFKFSGKREAARVEVGARDGAFFVRDNGSGFDAGAAKNLFGAFQRFHRAAEFAGTGIGLATVQRVIRRHGGRVWAESEPGKGAAFFFTLTPEAR